MRDINECTAEVFRRSREKINKRKRRRRAALAVCVPLCLCAVILTAFLPQLTGKSEKAELCSAYIYTQAEISCGSNSRSITNAAEIERIADKLDALYNDLPTEECVDKDAECWGGTLKGDDMLSGGSAMYGSNFMIIDTYENTESSSSAQTYTLTLYRADGTKIVYTLSDCLLTRTDSTDETITLTEKDAEELKQLFDLND